MPIKWLALESIQHRVYTHKSDVWSYGRLHNVVYGACLFVEGNRVGQGMVRGLDMTSRNGVVARFNALQCIIIIIVIYLRCSVL